MALSPPTPVGIASLASIAMRNGRGQDRPTLKRYIFSANSINLEQNKPLAEGAVRLPWPNSDTAVPVLILRL